MRVIVVSLALALALVATSAFAQKNGPGVTDKEIKIGQTQPYSGPVSAWSVQGRVDAAYVNRLNAQGGINGRKINLISLDDAYSPPKAVERARELVESEHVLGLFGSVGTVPNVAVAKYLNQRKVPHLLISSAAAVFADPKVYPWSTAFYMLQPTEAKLLARYVLAAKPDARIGVLYQNDDFGKGYLKAFRDALGDKAAKMIVKESSYDMTDPTVESQIIELKNSGADTLFNASTAKFGAQGDPQGGGPQLEAVAHHHPGHLVAGQCAEARGPAAVHGPRQPAVREVPRRSRMGQRSGHEGVLCVHEAMGAQ
jgi:ABC-type branched-subunit amino acid transport system substrate-binding protein